MAVDDSEEQTGGQNSGKAVEPDCWQVSEVLERLRSMSLPLIDDLLQEDVYSILLMFSHPILPLFNNS